MAFDTVSCVTRSNLPAEFQEDPEDQLSEQELEIVWAARRADAQRQFPRGSKVRHPDRRGSGVVEVIDDLGDLHITWDGDGTSIWSSPWDGLVAVEP